MVLFPISIVSTPGISAQHQVAQATRVALGPAAAAKLQLPTLPNRAASASAGGQPVTPASAGAAAAGEAGARNPAQGPAVKLVFVYNADSGPLNGFKDLLHKTFAPDTYECALCANTYQFSGMRPEWKQAVAALPLPTEFVHRDEFRQAYPALANQALPVAFSADAAGHLMPFISTQEMNTLTLPALIALTQQRARALVATP